MEPVRFRGQKRHFTSLKQTCQHIVRFRPQTLIIYKSALRLHNILDRSLPHFSFDPIYISSLLNLIYSAFHPFQAFVLRISQFLILFRPTIE
ncbi:hypothetical protein QVD17_06586 [Tagetes erecta]|uniref:Uncharacterized protein n=1 Tax=Tagetes erecta TaxID=13708 RepID=A0AAD8LNP4_TARER|nr:hypothetical protein QVD17_06586 [Tagetes erecta]